MPSEQFNNVAAMLQAAPISVDTPLEDMRTGYDMMGQLMATPDDVAEEPGEVGGVPGLWFSPAELDGYRTILYLHGGGYAIGSPSTHRALVSHLAKAARARVFSAEYRLAPEHPYPAAIDDSVAAYHGLLDSGIAARHIIIAGDSAGGGLTVATLVRLRDEGAPLPAGGVPISPWADLTQSGATMTTNAPNDVMVQKDQLDHWAKLYVGDTDPAHAHISPLFADLAGLPPMLVHVGTEEVLLDDSRRLADQINEAGGEVTLEIADGMCHVWHFFAGSVPESETSVAAVGAWIIDRTS